MVCKNKTVRIPLKKSKLFKKKSRIRKHKSRIRKHTSRIRKHKSRIRKHKSRIRKYNKTHSQKGGVVMRLTADTITNFRPMSQHGRDCCACVFAWLGLSMDDVRVYQRRYPNGMQILDLEAIMSHYYPAYTHTFSMIPYSDPDFALTYINSIIPGGYMRIGGFVRQNGTKHCIVFAYTGDHITIFDPQNAEHPRHNGVGECMGYLAINNVVSIFMMFSERLVLQADGSHLIENLILNNIGELLDGDIEAHL